MPRLLWPLRQAEILRTNRSFFQHRLFPARLISRSNIPCVVWGDNALVYGNDARIGLCSTLEVIVPDSLVERAGEIVIAKYNDTPEVDLIASGACPGELVRKRIEEERVYRESSLFDPNEEHAFPNALYLQQREEKVEGVDVLIHPASSLDFPISDLTKTMTISSRDCASSSLHLDESLWSQIRFPILGTFLDVLSAMILTPPLNKYHFQRNLVFEGYISALLGRQVLDKNKGFGLRTGSKRMGYQEVMEQIDPANKSFIERRCLGLPRNDDDDKRKRLEILAQR